MAEEPRSSDFEGALLDAIRHFFEERSAQPPPDLSETVSGRPLQLAATILFLQMIAADQEWKHDEDETLVAVLTRVLRIAGEDAAILIRFAEERVQTPLPKLLRVIKDRSTLIQKKKIVESMWQLAFADAELAGHEEYFVRKVAQALDLSIADLVETKILAREAFG